MLPGSSFQRATTKPRTDRGFSFISIVLAVSRVAAKIKARSRFLRFAAE
jgi:hypothetical protein